MIVSIVFRKILEQSTNIDLKRNAKAYLSRSVDFIRDLKLSSCFSLKERTSYTRYIKNQSPLTFNIHGGLHDDRLPKVTEMKASEGIVSPSGAFFHLS